MAAGVQSFQRQPHTTEAAARRGGRGAKRPSWLDTGAGGGRARIASYRSSGIASIVSRRMQRSQPPPRGGLLRIVIDNRAFSRLLGFVCVTSRQVTLNVRLLLNVENLQVIVSYEIWYSRYFYKTPNLSPFCMRTLATAPAGAVHYRAWGLRAKGLPLVTF
jgi:hypothetical protein